MKNLLYIVITMITMVFLILAIPRPVYAMHIMEGFLPLGWCIFWYIIAIPFFIGGLVTIRKMLTFNPRLKMLIGVAAAFCFVLSALKIPSVTGSCSHPTGVGLGTIMFGPVTITVIGAAVLLFQALLLAHGGLTTLGANLFSMAIVGPLLTYSTFRLVLRMSGHRSLAIFLATFCGGLSTYAITSFQLALAFPAPGGGFIISLSKFLGIFALTQIPLAISEGLLTVLLFNTLNRYNLEEMNNLSETREGLR